MEFADLGDDLPTIEDDFSDIDDEEYDWDIARSYGDRVGEDENGNLVVNEYHFIKLLGKGSFGSVYLSDRIQDEDEDEREDDGKRNDDDIGDEGDDDKSGEEEEGERRQFAVKMMSVSKLQKMVEMKSTNKQIDERDGERGEDNDEMVDDDDIPIRVDGLDKVR